MTASIATDRSATCETQRRATGIRAHVDVVVPWTAAVLVAGGLLTVHVLNRRTLDLGVDEAYFNQATWLIGHGKDPWITIAGLHLLGDHASFTMFPIAFVARIFPDRVGLGVVQSAAVGLACVPLYRFARTYAGLSWMPATVLLVAFAAQPALHNMTNPGFHPEVVAMPALFGAALFAMDERWILYGGCVAFVLLSKEDLAIVVATLGLVVASLGSRRAGFATTVVAIIWFAIAVGLVLPHFNGGTYQQAVRLTQYGDTTGDVLRFFGAHPYRIVSDVVTAQNAEKLFALLGPLLFLPLLSPRWLAPALPLELILLLSNQPGAHTIQYHYTVAFLVFAMLATAVALGRLLPRIADGTARMQVLALLLVAGGAFFVQYAIDSPRAHPWEWGRRSAKDQARIAAVDQVPTSAAVATSDGLLDAFSGRQFVYNFPRPFLFSPVVDTDPVSTTERVEDLEWVVIDRDDAWVWSVPRDETLESVLPQAGFEQIWERENVVVYRRVGARPD